MSKASILLIEPFYGGSHKQLIDLLKSTFSETAELYTMSSKKWHWRSITSSLHFSEIIPNAHKFRFLFTSSVLPLAELLALRPDLNTLHKVVYFHENQLNYPVRQQKQRYFQHGYNEIMSCLVADKIIFNSAFNKESFLSRLNSFFNVMPDYRPKNLKEQIENKCEVLFFPIQTISNQETCHTYLENEDLNHISDQSQLHILQTETPLHIVWPHRWEHDKDPETFFSIIHKLKETENFYLSVIGETFTEKPKVFEESYLRLKENILNWGYLPSKQDYYKVLQAADVVVSTSVHEFYGVSMLEATMLGCYPLCPNRLVYPEIYPDEHLYNTPNQLYKRLKYFCKRPKAARNYRIKVDSSKFLWDTLKIEYRNLFKESAA